MAVVDHATLSAVSETTDVLWRALVLGVPTVVLLTFSILRVAVTRSLSGVLQVPGTGCLLITVLTHVAEGWHLLPSMGWGAPHSVGHYVDLTSAVLGLTLLVGAVLLTVLGKKTNELSESGQ